MQNIPDLYKLTDEGYAYHEQSRQLQKHIGLHIQTFSLLSFLEPDEENDSLVVDAVTESDRLSDGTSLPSVDLNFDHMFIEDELPAHESHDEFNHYVLELDNDYKWDFVPIPDLGKPEHDPTLAIFVERARERLSKGGFLNLIYNKAYVPVGGSDYINVLAKYNLFATDERYARVVSRFENAGDVRNRRPQTLPVEEHSAQEDQEILAQITIGTSYPPQGSPFLYNN